MDDITRLRIKHPGTYTIHFNLICNSFSFELHTRDEVILFSEHNPKHGIHLEKDENCVLVFKQIPRYIRAGSKIYFIIIYRNETKTGIIIADSERKKNAVNTPSDFTYCSLYFILVL